MKTRILTSLILALAVQTSHAMKITGDAQGNIVTAGKTLTFTITEAKGTVHCTLVDYFGKTLKTGSGTTIAVCDLPPGWYELRCKDDAGSSSASLGVLIDRGNKPLSKEGRVAVDTIGAGANIAKLVRLAGIPWVRERFYWCAVQYGPGPIDWKWYPEYARKIAAEGLNVSQTFHDFPPWVLTKNPNIIGPDDFREVYKFSRALAEKFAGQWDVWEIGNENDYSWQGIGERFAAHEKAASLGIRDGNPNAVVVAASLAKIITPFLTQVYECGLADYTDVFNWHSYEDPSQYPGITQTFLSFLKQHHADTRPLWITEGGWPLTRELTWKSQCEITQVSIRKLLAALAAGNDKYFWFCMPDHFERGLQFNLIKGDYSPYPQFIAYSAAANIIGESDFLGQYNCGAPTYVFSTPRGTVAAVWAPKSMQIDIPTDKATVTLVDPFGAEHQIRSEHGKVRITVGPETSYLIGLGSKIKTALVGTPRPRGKITPKNPSRVIVSAHSDVPVNYDRGHYYFKTRTDIKPFKYTVEVYNLDEKNKRSGSIFVTPPAGWRISARKADLTLQPMDRQILTFDITPVACTNAQSLNARIRVGGHFDNIRVSPCVSYFGFDAAILSDQANSNK